MYERLKMFIWRVGTSTLPTNQNYVLKVVFGDPKCPLHQGDYESLIHLFFHYPISRTLWFGQGWCLRHDNLNLAALILLNWLLIPNCTQMVYLTRTLQRINLPSK